MEAATGIVAVKEQFAGPDWLSLISYSLSSVLDGTKHSLLLSLCPLETPCNEYGIEGVFFPLKRIVITF